MFSRFETIGKKYFVGKNGTISLADNSTFELWRSFMPRRNEIINRIGSEYYSIEIYPPSYFNAFSPKTTFEKWAAVEVQHLDEVPVEMKTLIVPEGKYAVFIHKGEISKAPATFEYIFTKYGYLSQNSRWMSVRIWLLWEINTKMIARVRKRRFGFQSRKNKFYSGL